MPSRCPRDCRASVQNRQRAQQRHAALTRTHEFTRAAQLQILTRDFKTIGMFENDSEAFSGRGRERILIQQNTYAAGRAASYAAAQLMQLRQPHAFGMLDHHQRCIRHIYAYFDNGRRYQQLHVASRKRIHDY